MIVSAALKEKHELAQASQMWRFVAFSLFNIDVNVLQYWTVGSTTAITTQHELVMAMYPKFWTL